MKIVCLSGDREDSEYRRARRHALPPRATTHLSARTSTEEILAAIYACDSEYVLVVDEHTRLHEVWPEPGVDARTALIGAPVHTALGKRLGFKRETSLLTANVQRRAPMGMPADGSAAYCQIDFPNDGGIVFCTRILRELGGLHLALPYHLAAQEFAVRAREMGFACVSDRRMTAYRAAGYAEPSISDEQDFAKLRLPATWAEFLRGPARAERTEIVDLVVFGQGAEGHRCLQHAGHPIDRIYWTSDQAPPAGLDVVRAGESAAAVCDRLLSSRRGRVTAILDIGAQPVMYDWLLRLLEEGDERRDIAAAVIGSDDTARAVSEMDARMTVLFGDRIPVTILPRNADNIESYLTALAANFTGAGIGIRQTADRLFRPHLLAPPVYEPPARGAVKPPRKADIIVLSAGVSDANELTTTRLRTNTRDPYDVTYIVRRTANEIVKRLRADSVIRTLIDPTDRGVAELFSNTLAQSRGELVVCLRDDIVLPDQWLEPLEAALARIPGAGIVAPRVSNGLGPQAAANERFANTAEFNQTAIKRRREFARMATPVGSVVHPIFVARRDVIERVGGLDPQFGTTEFAFLDYSIRVLAAGFAIVVAEDALVHKIHQDVLGLESNAANDARIARAFAKKWQLGRESLLRPDIPAIARTELAIAQIRIAAADAERTPELVLESEGRAVFLLPVQAEADWQDASRLIKKYLKTFAAADNVSLAIGCSADYDLATVGRRVERVVNELGIDEDSCADVIISNADDADAWLARLPGGPRLLLREDARLSNLAPVRDVSPSGLRKSLALAVEGGA